MKKKPSKSPAKDSGKVKETVKEAKENLKKIEMPPPIPKIPEALAPPKVTPLVVSPTQAPVSEKSFTDIYEELQDDTPTNWNSFIDKVAALGLCAGFISLGIVIGLNIH